jgi:hypothetical protein
VDGCAVAAFFFLGGMMMKMMKKTQAPMARSGLHNLDPPT